MELTVGTIVEGTVKSITKFGAFVALDENQVGMVHISEVAYAYVNDIHDHLAEGQNVKVMVIGLENGKINLSIKKAHPQERTPPQRGYPAPVRGKSAPNGDGKAVPGSFDDMLKRFMADSDSKISDIRQYSDRKTKTRRR